MVVLRLLKELENGHTLRLQSSRNLDVNLDVQTSWCLLIVVEIQVL